MKGTRISVLLSLVLIANMTVANAATSQTRDERAVRAASAAWQRYILAQQIDSIVALHTPDAVVMFGNAPVSKGSDQIRTQWGDIMKIPAFKVQWTPTWVDVASPTRATVYRVV